MAEPEYVVVYAATYPTVAAARAALDTIQHLHKEVAGVYDAAVVDKENGKAHVVRRLDHPHVRVIPEWFGGGALTRKELNDAAGELLASQAGLIVVGEATIEPALDKAFAGTAKVFKREMAASVDQITSELQEAFKG
jgi:predicted regulator of Ras-like GTPase activity (Roadblock/LC7/MglB family)